MTVPTRFIVGATGVRTATQAHADGTTTYTYEQADVHDFAWTASPRFVEITRRFEAAREVTAADYAAAAARLDRPIDQLRLGDVEVRLLMQPEHRPQAERYLAAAMRAIEAFGLAYGPYPYRTLTIVDPPEEAIGTGGMEYPTFFTAGTSALLNTWPFDRIREPEDVVVHEFGHQYFQGLVASNEFEEPWLDEGITTWASAQVMDGLFGPDRSLLVFAGVRAGEIDQLRAGLDRRHGAEMIRQPAWTYDDGYPFNAYFRPALVLRTLEGLLGERTVARIMRTYAERWRFGHPSSDDLYAVASEVAGRDLTPFFRQTIESPVVVDYQLGGVETAAGPDGRARAAARRSAGAGGRRLQVRRAPGRAPHVGRRRPPHALRLHLRHHARMGRRRPRSPDRARRVVAEQRPAPRRRRPPAGVDDGAVVARGAAGARMAVVLSRAASMKDRGPARSPWLARLWCGGAVAARSSPCGRSSRWCRLPRCCQRWPGGRAS